MVELPLYTSAALTTLMMLTLGMATWATAVSEPGQALSLSITGRLVTTGVEHSRLNRRDVTSLLKNDTHQVFLQLDDGSPTLSLKLYRGMVWGAKSVLQARWGRHRLRFTAEGDDDCHVYGRVTSLSGFASLNLCGRLTGHIHTPEHHLELEEMTSNGDKDHDPTCPELKVIKTKVKDSVSVDGVEVADELVRRKENGLGQGYNATGKEDEVLEVTIEVAIFADARYMSHLYDLGYDTTRKVHGWFIHKWNTIQGVYSEVKRVGVKARFKIVKMELWWYDPADYVSPSVNESVRLDWFCRNTPQADGVDQKVLYTLGTGVTKYDSWAKVGKTCVPKQNCYLVKSPTLGVAIELHEMGHSFGLLHDNQMEGCRPPQGFMGPGYNYLYKECYKTSLLKRLGKMECLYRDDFVDTEKVPALPFWLEFV